MAKVSFAKLGLSKNQEIKNVPWGEYMIEIKQYLPVNEKLALISNVINAAHDENSNYSNPVKIDVFTSLEIMYAYTNINFTDKQKEDATKLYDSIVSSGLYGAVIDAIPKNEYNTILEGIERSVNSIYAYQHSALGILDTIATDYSELSFDAATLQQQIGDPNNMSLLKDIMAKLG